MSVKKIGATLALEGEREFRSAITSINTELRTLQSEMRLTTTQFDGNANSMNGLRAKGDVLAKQYEAQKSKVNVYREAVAKASAQEEISANKVKALEEGLKAECAEMERMQSATGTTTEELSEQQEAIDDLSEQLRFAQDEYRAAGNTTNQWQNSLNTAEADLIDLDREIQDNNRYMEEAERSTDDTASSIDEYGREVQDATKETSTFGSVLKANLVSEMIVAGVKAIANGIKEISGAVVSVGMDFEASMTEVAATMGITVEEIDSGSASFDMLQAAAKECGETTKYSASESAQALNYLALAGYDAEKAVSTLPRVLTFASAANMDLASTTDMATDAVSALNIGTERMDELMDKMAMTATKSNTNVAQLGEGILTVGGTAQQLSGGITELNMSLGVLADNGIKGAEGGTHLRNIILAMTPTTSDATAAFKELNLETYDSQGNLRSLNDIFSDMNAAMSDMTAKERQNIITKMFKVTDLASVTAMLGNCGDRMDELTGYINDSAGAAKNMSDTLENNLKGEITKLESATEALGITVYEKFQNKFRAAVSGITSEVSNLNREMTTGRLGEKFDDLAESFGEVAEGAISFGAKALPAVLSGLTWVMENANFVATGIVGIATATKMLNTVGMTTPLGALVTIGTTLAATLATLIITTENAGTEFGNYRESIHETIEALQEMNESASEVETTYAESKTAVEGNMSACGNLADRYYILADKTKRTVAEEAEMKKIVQELSKSIPGLSDCIDETTGLLTIQRDEYDKLSDAALEYYLAQAKADYAMQKASELAEAQRTLADAEAQLDEVRKRKGETDAWLIELEAQLTDETHRTGDEVNALRTEYSNAQVESAMLASDIENLSGELENSRVIVNGLEEDYYALGGGTDAATGSMDGLAESTKTTEGVLVEFGGRAKTVSQESADAFGVISDKYDEVHQAAETSIRGQLELFGEWSENSEVTKESLIENLESQKVGLENYKENFGSVIGLITEKNIEGSEAFVQALVDAGAGASGELAALNKMSETELREYIKTWNKTNFGVTKEIADMQANAVTGAKNIYDNMAETGKGIERDLPLSAKRAGSGFYGNLSSEILIGLGKVSGAVSAVRSAADISIEMGGIGSNSGGSFIDKLGQSLKNGKNPILDIASGIAAGMRKTFGISSPSKVFAEIGNFCGLGFEEGMISSLETANMSINREMEKITGDLSASTGQLSMDAHVTSSSQGAINTLAGARGYNQTQGDVYQEINIHQPVESPVEMAREMKRIGKELAFG